MATPTIQAKRGWWAQGRAQKRCGRLLGESRVRSFRSIGCMPLMVLSTARQIIHALPLFARHYVGTTSSRTWIAPVAGGHETLNVGAGAAHPRRECMTKVWKFTHPSRVAGGRSSLKAGSCHRVILLPSPLLTCE